MSAHSVGAWEAKFRNAFEIYTCHQGGTDTYLDAFFQRLESEPFTGKRPCNWLWDVFNDAASKVKRVTPATKAALAEALANRDAILAIELPADIRPLAAHERTKIDLQLLAGSVTRT
jgi:hypothetical protein